MSHTVYCPASKCVPKPYSQKTTLPAYSGANAAPGLEWQFEPLYVERRLDVSYVVTGASSGEVRLAYRMRVGQTNLDPNTSPDGTRERWMDLGSNQSNTTPDPTITGIWPRVSFVLPAFADGVRVVSTLDVAVNQFTMVMYVNGQPMASILTGED